MTIAGTETGEGAAVAGDFDAAGLTETLRRSFTLALGPDLAADALGEALACFAADEDRIAAMANPVGYLYTVGRRRALRFWRPRRSSKVFPNPA